MTNIVNKKIDYIAVKYLSVRWRQAQRPYDEKHSRHICENFDPDKFDPITVTKPNGEGIYHIIRGQHRRYALEMYSAKVDPKTASDEKAPCHIVDIDPEDAPVARSAEIFLGEQEGIKTVRQTVQFNVAVTATREDEVAIDKIVRKNDYIVSSVKKDNSIRAVSAIKRVYSQYGGMILSKTLATLRTIWGSDPNAVSHHLILGFAMFLNEFYNADVRKVRKSIVERRPHYSPFEFVEAAKALSKTTKESVNETIAEQIRKIYNKHLPASAHLKRKS